MDTKGTTEVSKAGGRGKYRCRVYSRSNEKVLGIGSDDGYKVL